MAEKNMLEEGRARLSRLEQQSQVPPPVVPSSRVAELEQQINALVQERDAFRAAAIPTKKRGPVTPRPPQSSTEARGADDARWQTSCRTPRGGGCDARGCTRFVRMVDRSTMRFARRHGIRGSAISGPFESVDLGRSREVAGVGRSEPCHVDGVKYGAMRSVDLWTVASARDARYGLRGMRVGEVNNPGPRRLWRQRFASSSEDELLFRPTEGRDVIPRMESRIESNRFAALADPETVPAGTQELEAAGLPGIATEFQKPFFTHLKRIWSDPVVDWCWWVEVPHHWQQRTHSGRASQFHTRQE